jgi:hypothetical protein
MSEADAVIIVTAVDAMVDSLPEGDNVPDVDRADAERDRSQYVELQRKLRFLGLAADINAG